MIAYTLPLLAILLWAFSHFLYKEHQFKKRFSAVGIYYLGNGNVRLIKNLIKRINLFDDATNIYWKIKNRGDKLGGANDLGVTTLFLTDPELIKSVLIKDFDHFVDRRIFDTITPKEGYLKKTLLAVRRPEWRMLRHKISPAFTSGKMRQLMPLFIASAEKLMKYFADEAALNPENEIEITKGFSKYILHIIATAVCGVDSHAFEKKESVFEQMARKMQIDFEDIRVVKLLIMVVMRKVGEFLGIVFFDKEMQDFFSQAIIQSIREREAKKEKKTDFLQFLLSARDGSLKTEDRDLSELEDLGFTRSNISNPESLDDEGLVANAVMFIMSGLDTTLCPLIYMPYVLALHPEVQDRLRSEINSVLETYGGDMCYEAIADMTYLDMVMNETLRLYVPAPAVDRTCVKNYKVPGTDFVLEKGGGVVIPIYPIQHDPEYFPDPEKFDPERFSPENRGKIHICTFLPFGQGPRSCVGTRYAIPNVKVAMAHLVRNFRIVPSRRTLIPMKFSLAPNLKPEGGMHLAFQKII